MIDELRGRGAAVLLLLASAGCTSMDHRLDPQARWRSAESRRAHAMASVEVVTRLRSDYEAVALLARDGDLRARSFCRLAEIDSALGHHERALEDLERALLAGPSPETQRVVLLALGDILSRRLRDPDRARRTYQQIITEYPGTSEAELARWRLEDLGDGR